MVKYRWVATVLVLLLALVVSACGGHPEGIKSLRKLTEAEKAKVIEIALQTPQAQKQLEKSSQYKTNLSWIAIVWKGKDYSEYRGIAYDWERDENLRLVKNSSEFYSRVTINFGEPPKWQVSVAVNPDTGKVALVEENPFLGLDRFGPPK